MKRMITGSEHSAALNEVAMSRITSDLNGELLNTGYDISFDISKARPELRSTCPDINTMPQLTLELEVDPEGIVRVIPSLSFPDLTYNRNSDYYDDMHYWLSKWEQLGNCMSNINVYEFDLSSLGEE